jgi:hypothetical protein
VQNIVLLLERFNFMILYKGIFGVYVLTTLFILFSVKTNEFIFISSIFFNPLGVEIIVPLAKHSSMITMSKNVDSFSRISGSEKV